MEDGLRDWGNTSACNAKSSRWRGKGICACEDGKEGNEAGNESVHCIWKILDELLKSDNGVKVMCDVTVTQIKKLRSVQATVQGTVP
jgi:hypothetical protein